MWHWLVHIIMTGSIILLCVDRLTFCWVRRIYQLVYRINYRLAGWLIFLDLNDLKKINDRFGHEKGNQLLRQFGKVIVKASRARAFRYGGDEFVILTFSKNRQKAEKILRRIQSQFAAMHFCYGFGKTEEQADEEMYKMKKNKGR